MFQRENKKRRNCFDLQLDQKVWKGLFSLSNMTIVIQMFLNEMINLVKT